MKNGLLTVIVPAYNEQDNISAISAKVKAALEPEGIPYELLFVDDGSSDGTWQAIGEASRTDGAVRGLRFSRNFGKEGAMFAGLAEARGECVALIDADLQHPPEALGRMYKLWQQGEADIVEGKKLRRGKESLVYKAFAGLFYGMMKAMSGVDLANSSDFKLLDRKVVNTLMAMPERRTFFRAMSEWTGFKTAEVGFEVAPRNSGKSKFSARKLIKYALSSTASYTNVPAFRHGGRGYNLSRGACPCGHRHSPRRLRQNHLTGSYTVHAACTAFWHSVYRHGRFGILSLARV